jgi:hypothetical protein
VWETDYGTLELEVQGNRATGTYGDCNGCIEAAVNGNILHGTWRQDAVEESGLSWGNFMVTLSDDGESFTGRWNYCDDYAPDGGDWTGERSEE